MKRKATTMEYLVYGDFIDPHTGLNFILMRGSSAEWRAQMVGARRLVKEIVGRRVKFSVDHAGGNPRVWNNPSYRRFKWVDGAWKPMPFRPLLSPLQLWRYARDFHDRSQRGYYPTTGEAARHFKATRTVIEEMAAEGICNDKTYLGLGVGVGVRGGGHASLPRSKWVVEAY